MSLLPFLSATNIHTRSKKEIERLHQMHKPIRPKIKDDLPSIESGDEESEDDWSSNIDDEELSIPDSEDEASDASAASSSSSSQPRRRKAADSDSDAEMPYEAKPRKRRPEWEPESEKDKGIERLPIKLADGRIQKTNAKVYLPKEGQDDVSEDESSDEAYPEPPHKPVVEDVSTGARFGRPAVVDVVGHKSRKARIQLAKEQIASICQEIVSDPENSVRIHIFILYPR